MSSENVDHYLWIMLKKPLLVVVNIFMNSEDADSARETSTSSNQYFFSLNSEFSIAWRVESRTQILIRLKINVKSSHKIDIKYSSQVTTLISSTQASQKVDMKTWLNDQSNSKSVVALIDLRNDVKAYFVNILINFSNSQSVTLTSRTESVKTSWH